MAKKTRKFVYRERNREMVGGGIEGRHFHVAFVTEGGGVEEIRARSLQNSYKFKIGAIINGGVVVIPFFVRCV